MKSYGTSHTYRRRIGRIGRKIRKVSKSHNNSDAPGKPSAFPATFTVLPPKRIFLYYRFFFSRCKLFISIFANITLILIFFFNLEDFYRGKENQKVPPPLPRSYISFHVFQFLRFPSIKN